MLNDITGEGNSQIVPETLFAKLSSKVSCCAICKVIRRDAAQEVAAVQYLEEQFIAFFAILAHQGGQVFHCGSLDLLESIERIDLANRVENVVTTRHFLWSEVACTLWYAWFLRHNINSELL